MSDFFARISEWIDHTQVLEQIRAVDATGLFLNPYFLAPFICLVIYNLYRQTFTNLMIIGLCLGLWYFSGTKMVREAVVDGVVQMSNILPIAAIGIGGVAVLIYLLFIRQD